MKTYKNILLIEDDKDDQFLFKEIIDKCPDANLVHIANNGKEALEWLNTSTSLPDLIFSDINMPLMNGIECFREILNTPSLCSLPVVFLSSDTSMIEYVGVLGAKTFIKKSSDEILLKKQIESITKMQFIELLKPAIRNHQIIKKLKIQKGSVLNIN